MTNSPSRSSHSYHIRRNGDLCQVVWSSKVLHNHTHAIPPATRRRFAAVSHPSRGATAAAGVMLIFCLCLSRNPSRDPSFRNEDSSSSRMEKDTKNFLGCPRQENASVSGASLFGQDLRVVHVHTQKRRPPNDVPCLVNARAKFD